MSANPLTETGKNLCDWCIISTVHFITFCKEEELSIKFIFCPTKFCTEYYYLKNIYVQVPDRSILKCHNMIHT